MEDEWEEFYLDEEAEEKLFGAEVERETAKSTKAETAQETRKETRKETAQPAQPAQMSTQDILEKTFTEVFERHLSVMKTEIVRELKAILQDGRVFQQVGEVDIDKAIYRRMQEDQEYVYVGTISPLLLESEAICYMDTYQAHRVQSRRLIKEDGDPLRHVHTLGEAWEACMKQLGLLEEKYVPPKIWWETGNRNLENERIVRVIDRSVFKELQEAGSAHDVVLRRVPGRGVEVWRVPKHKRAYLQLPSWHASSLITARTSLLQAHLQGKWVNRNKWETSLMLYCKYYGKIPSQSDKQVRGKEKDITKFLDNHNVWPTHVAQGFTTGDEYVFEDTLASMFGSLKDRRLRDRIVWHRLADIPEIDPYMEIQVQDWLTKFGLADPDSLWVGCRRHTTTRAPNGVSIMLATHVPNEVDFLVG